METVRVELGERSYCIRIGDGILADIGKEIKGFAFSETLAIVSNPTVYSLYGETVKDSIEREGHTVHEIIIPDGEQYKNLEWVGNILTKLLEKRLDRKSAVIALGGGVIGDIACFAASLYMRGIACVQVPTTLLSQVDSSVGGKTGVNHKLGKNMIGTFYQPSLVWIDPLVLGTLREREFLAGIAEIIKYGVIRDADLFDFLHVYRSRVMERDTESLALIIRRSCEIKADIVAADERESGVRAILNFGHTVGHAVETLTDYVAWLHGEAVAIGMYHEAVLAHVLSICDELTVDTVADMIKDYRLPTKLPDTLEGVDIIDAMKLDKKTVGGRLTFILPERIGSVRILHDIDFADLQDAFGAR